MLILSATGGDSGQDAGALIDAESCARMAVAGFDPETEIRLDNCAELLASSGDLLNLPAGTESAGQSTTFVILGLKWHAPARD
jgi:glycerate-2-kinase